MASSSPSFLPHITTRFLQLRDTVVAGARCPFRDLPAAMRELHQKVANSDSNLSIAPPPTIPHDIHAEELLRQLLQVHEIKSHPSNNKPATTSLSNASLLPPPPAASLFAHFRRNELLQIGCALDRVPPGTSGGNVLRYSSFDPRTRCAYMSFEVVASNEEESGVVVESVSQHRRNGASTGETGPSLEEAFSNFMALFRNNSDSATGATLSEYSLNGEFFILLPDTRCWSKFEFYAVLACEPPPIPVVLDHDGGIDDILALLLLASATVRPLASQPRRINLIGTTVVDADCFAQPAAELCRRALCLLHPVSADICNIAIGVSPLQQAAGAAPFPPEWRKDCMSMLDLPLLHTRGVSRAVHRAKETDQEGHELLARLVMTSPSPVTLIVTGPLTNVAYALNKYGEAFARNVREVSVMGGAIFVKGNVEPRNLPPGHHPVDTSQEWNLYWDAQSARDVLQSPLLAPKVLLFSTDATNHVPVTSQVVRRFGKVSVAAAAKFASLPIGSTSASTASSAPLARGSDFATIAIDKLLDKEVDGEAAAAAALGGRSDDDDDDPDGDTPTQLANFFGSSWAQTTYLRQLYGELGQYCSWDVCAAACVLSPQLVRYALTRVEVDATRGGRSEGRTRPVETGGALLRVGVAIDAAAFDNIVLEASSLC